MRTPTKQQYDRLLNLGSGAAGLSATKRVTDALLRHGWVTAKWVQPYYQFVRITPDGLRALALAVEKFGLPEMGRKEQPLTTWVRVCGDCGSGRYRFEEQPVDPEKGWTL